MGKIKAIYEKAEIMILALDKEDVIRTSVPWDTDIYSGGTREIEIDSDMGMGGIAN